MLYTMIKCVLLEQYNSTLEHLVNKVYFNSQVLLII